MVGLKRNRRKVQIVQKSSGSWIGLKRCPGLVDFDNCDLVTYSQSLRTARADKNGNSVSFSTVLTIVSSMSILSWSTDSSTLSRGNESRIGGSLIDCNSRGKYLNRESFVT